MQVSFTFCGVDIKSFGLNYVPQLRNTFVYANSPYNLDEQMFEGHHGGYYYGSTVKPKDFTLRCYFEQHEINKGILSRICNFFCRNKTGRLVFSDRKYMYYIATVTNCDVSTLTNFMNGFVTISLRAYYPFALCDDIAINDEDTSSYTQLIENTALLPKTMLPPLDIIDAYGDGGSLNTGKEFLLYNAGAEYTCTTIMLRGNVGEGVVITNKTTGQKCRLCAPGGVIEEDELIICDSMNGKTVIEKNGTKEMAFLYHDEGFIELAPAYPIKRDVFLTSDKGKLTTFGQLDEDITGKYVFIPDEQGESGEWKKITSFEVSDEGECIEIDGDVPESRSFYTSIVSMNEITVEPISTMDLTKLQFQYKTAFS